MMGEAAARTRDLEARRLAQTVFDRAVVLEAGAGTGKTAALVARIVAWSVGPGWDLVCAGHAEDDLSDERVATQVLDGIVAITFTEDAAAEMARRVAQAFDDLHNNEKLRHGHEWGDDEEVMTGLFRAALPANGAVVVHRAEALLAVLERLRVSTIHAFARALIARFPVEAGLHPAFEVDADGRLVAELVDEAIEDVIGRAYRGVGAGQTQVEESADALHLAALGIGPAAVREAALALVEDAVPADALGEDPFTDDRIVPLLDDLRGCLDSVLSAARILGDGGTSVAARTVELIKGVENVDRENEAAAALQRMRTIKEWVQAQEKYETALDRMKDWGRGKLIKTETKVLGPEVTIPAEPARRLAVLLGWILKVDSEQFGAMRRTLRRILEAVEVEKRRRGIVVFQELLVGARRLLEDNPSVLRILRGEISQLLVDEMQDTDDEQARIVRRLVGIGDDAGDGPCLFLVGDPKQSIYGWRNADMAVYRRLVKDVETEGGVVRSLTVNFRSVQPVLDEVERLVKPSMIEEEGLQPKFEGLQAGVPDDASLAGNRQVVEHWLSAAAGEDGGPQKTSAAPAADIEAEAVARDVVGLHEAGVPLDEMAVLLRSRSHQAAYLEALRRYGVPYVVGKDPNYFRMREVGEAIALVRLVLDPFDNLALAAVLRSPMVGVPDAALRPLWAAGLPGKVSRLGAGEVVDDLREAVAVAAADVEQLDLGSVSLDPFKGWPESVLAFSENLILLRHSFVEDPPDLFLENLRLRTLIEPLAAGRFPGHYRLANLDRFFRDLGEMLSGGATAAAILRRLRQAERERPDEESGRPRSDAHGVRVLTIHGAKGLGFSHVWVAQTFACGRVGTSNRSAAVHERGRWEMTLQGMASPGYLEVERRGERVEEAERVRLLYVALTRARRRLVTVGNSLPAAGGKGPIGKLLEKRTDVWLSAGEDWGSGEVGPRIDRDEAQWVWLGHPDLEANVPGSGLVHAAEGSVAPFRVAEDARLLQQWKKEAGQRQARPWLERATDEAHRQAREALGARLEGVDEAPAVGGEDGIDRRVATAVGTAVHAMLERFDMEADDPVAELDNQSVNAASWLRVFLGSGESSERGLARLEELVKGFRRGALWQSLLALRGHVLARELPLVATPEPGGAVGAVTGAIDLVYRDPVTDELVIADFKTDRVESGQEIADRAAAYAHQLDIYARAAEAALKLETSPRRELWFLHPGRIVVLE